MRALPAPPLLVITDRVSATHDLIEMVGACLRAGCRWIMVREKDLATPDLTTLAGDIVALARPFGARIVVNGDLEAAVAARSDGVHLQSGEDIAAARVAMGDGALIGLSCHARSELQAALAAGADYATYSPVFLTESKPGYGPALGLEGLRGACAATPGPVIALAGISKDNAADCLRAGAAGIAVMGGVMRADDPEATTREFLKAMAR